MKKCVVLLFPLFSLPFAGCVDLTGEGCSGGKTAEELTADYCCCTVADAILSGYGGGDCDSLGECHGAGYYYPELFDYSAPDYSDGGVTSWQACYLYDDEPYLAAFGECDVAEGEGYVPVCPEEIQGVWATDILTYTLEESDDGYVCSTVGIQLYFSFPGLGPNAHALGVFSGAGLVEGGEAAVDYETLLSTDGNLYAVASGTALGNGTIEISTVPSNCTSSELLANVTYSLEDMDGDGVVDSMTTDFSRDPAAQPMHDNGCASFGFHGVTFYLLDSSDPTIVDILDATAAFWEENSTGSDCDAAAAELYGTCEDPLSTEGDTGEMTDTGTAADTGGTVTASEFLATLSPRPADYPVNGYFPAASYSTVASKWLGFASSVGTGSGAAKTEVDKLFANNGAKLVQLVGSSVLVNFVLEEIKAETLTVLDRLKGRDMQLEAITILAARWQTQDHGGMTAGDLEWYVAEVIRSIPAY